MLGVYLRPGRVAPFLHVAISELADRALAVGDVWGSEGGLLPHELAELDEAGRIERLEAVLLEHAARSRPRHESVDVEGLAASVQRRQGRVTVEGLARAAGVSRQHLSRRFRERIGISPKLYARLARFHAGLGFAGAREPVDWAGVALDMGYADQSHMIAEFRQFSGLTPHTLATGSWFHPVIERSRRAPARRDHRG